MSTLKDCQSEVTRELTLRRSVYPKLIQQKKLHPDQARKQFDRLQMVATLLVNMTEKQFLELLKQEPEVKKNPQLELL